MSIEQKSKPKRKRVESPFSKNLKAVLGERGLTQKSAAEIMGIGVSVVHDWLQGAIPNDPNAVLKLCKAINCDFQWLLTGDRSPRQIGSPNLAEIFDVQDDPMFSGVFMIEAKRLLKKGSPK